MTKDKERWYHSTDEDHRAHFRRSGRPRTIRQPRSHHTRNMVLIQSRVTRCPPAVPKSNLTHWVTALTSQGLSANVTTAAISSIPGPSANRLSPSLIFYFHPRKPNICEGVAQQDPHQQLYTALSNLPFEILLAITEYLSLLDIIRLETSPSSSNLFTTGRAISNTIQQKLKTNSLLLDDLRGAVVTLSSLHDGC